MSQRKYKIDPQKAQDLGHARKPKPGEPYVGTYHTGDGHVMHFSPLGMEVMQAVRRLVQDQLNRSRTEEEEARRLHQILERFSRR